MISRPHHPQSMATMRPTKSFVVEHKRNSRSISGSSTITIPLKSVEGPRSAVRRFVTASQAAADALFKKVDEARPSSELPQVTRRILPVILVERVASPAPETRPVRSSARDPAPKVPRPKAKAAIQPVLSEDTGFKRGSGGACCLGSAYTPGPQIAEPTCQPPEGSGRQPAARPTLEAAFTEVHAVKSILCAQLINL